MIAARAKVDADPTLFESLDLVGPVVLGKLTKWRFGRGPSDGEQIDEGLRAGLAQADYPSGTRFGLGFVLIGEESTDDLQARLDTIKTSVELAALHPMGRGVSFSNDPLPTADVAPVEMLAGVARLDSSIVSAASLIMNQLVTEEPLLIPSDTMSQFVAGLKLVEPDESAGPLAPPQANNSVVDDRGSATGAHSSEWSSTDAQVAVGALPPLAPPPPPLRLTYFVIDAGQDSRPRKARARLMELVAKLDKGLMPRDSTIVSETCLIDAVAPGRIREPKPTGTIRPDDIWRPSNGLLDLAESLTQLHDLMIRHRESRARRRIELARPLVLFVLPTAAMYGARTLIQYRRIKDLADVGWLVTREDGPAPSAEIDPDKLVYDHSDVVNELLYKIGYPEDLPDLPQPDPTTNQQEKENE